jgi:hypothetical protein
MNLFIQKNKMLFMPCCGNKRQSLQNHESYTVNNPFINREEMTPQKNIIRDVPFEYIGETGLIVNGGVTGRRYRFNHKGEVQLIDYRDAGSMMAIASLKKVKS